jgi:hypothetical protein
MESRFLTNTVCNPVPAPRGQHWLMRAPWAIGFLLYALLAAMVYFRLAHPHFLPVVSLLALLVILSFVALLVGLWRLNRGPRRLDGLRICTVATLPLLLVVFHGSWLNAQDIMALRSDGSYKLRIMLPLAASFLDLDAKIRYPERTEGRKVVMIHDGIANAEKQVEAMDRHVERMEHLLGRQADGKVHWVRGELLGLGQLPLWGIALGSKPGKRLPGPDGLTMLDRHEVAHWMIDQFSTFYQGPRPLILTEGWAESQSGYAPRELFGQAARSREADSWVPLKDLILPGHPEFEWRVYKQGGVLVDYLLTTYGGPAFFAFYQDCTAHSFEADLRRHFGLGLEELEAAYTKYLDNVVASHGSLTQWRLENIPSGPNVEPGKWQEFIRKYVATLEPPSKLNVHFTVSVIGPNASHMEFAVSGPYAYQIDKDSNGGGLIRVAHPPKYIEMRREASGKPWIANPNDADSESYYKSGLQRLRENASGRIMPTLLYDDPEIYVDPGFPTVTELVEFNEEGKPRLRVMIENRRVTKELSDRQTMMLAVDQAYVPIRVEIDNPNTGENAVYHARREYELVEGHFIVRKQFDSVVDKDGKLVRESSQEIKDCKFGLLPPERFTLAALGVTEPPIVEPSKEPQLATSWKKRLPRWIAGWILFCVAAWVIVRRL